MLLRALLVIGIGLVAVGLIVGMGSEVQKSALSTYIMFGGVGAIGLWFVIRLYGDLTRPNPEDEIQERLKQRELEKQKRKENEDQ